MTRRVLSLCDKSGVMVQPWLDAGYDCTIVDIQHEPGVQVDGKLTKVGADVTSYLPDLDDYMIVFAFPPCTHLSVAGARWFRDKGLPALIEGLTLVEACRRICEWTKAPYMIENPTGTLATYWRPPDYTFHPYEYGGYITGGGDRYTKRTHLWCNAGFVMPDKLPVIPSEGSKMHEFLPRGPGRSDARSVTPEGFSRAVFEANNADFRI